MTFGTHKFTSFLFTEFSLLNTPMMLQRLKFPFKETTDTIFNMITGVFFMQSIQLVNTASFDLIAWDPC